MVLIMQKINEKQYYEDIQIDEFALRYERIVKKKVPKKSEKIIC